jgi:predicted transcriptional regulator
VTNKELVIRKVRELPDDASLRDIVEEIAILAAIREGEDDIDAGRFVTHEELKRQVAQWLSK